MHSGYSGEAQHYPVNCKYQQTNSSYRSKRTKTNQEMLGKNDENMETDVVEP